MVSDRLMKVWVAIDPNRVEEMRGHVAWIAGQLKQECLYFEVTEAEVDLVRPSSDTGELF